MQSKYEYSRRLKKIYFFFIKEFLQKVKLCPDNVLSEYFVQSYYKDFMNIIVGVVKKKNSVWDTRT